MSKRGNSPCFEDDGNDHLFISLDENPPKRFNFGPAKMYAPEEHTDQPSAATAPEVRSTEPSAATAPQPPPHRRRVLSSHPQPPPHRRCVLPSHPCTGGTFCPQPPQGVLSEESNNNNVCMKRSVHES
ncbi:hypothetical protein AVEN_265115-1 [Araneus ventricosus]|uniref:Uncharacterized protein n=1 Tax=Araneus ventricosus TaxID=182803 RepID=A0A4Y2NJ51_ARAVE|nr:hypothetical protein AVEN_265115-1 [Araneus ventricosus]